MLGLFDHFWSNVYQRDYRPRLLAETFNSHKEKPCPGFPSQGIASWRPAIRRRNLRLRLATACVDLRWLASTLMELKFSRKRTQVLKRLATQRKSTQVDANWLQYCFPLCEGAWKAALKWPFFATCVALASSCKSIWPLIASLPSQVHIS